MLNLQVIGNLGRDASVERGNRGEFVSFSVAHSYKYTDQQGQQINATTWLSCIMNGKQEKLLPFLKKGTKVFCSGTMSTRLYRDRSNQPQVGINLNVQHLELCGQAQTLPPQEQQTAADFQQQQQQTAAQSGVSFPPQPAAAPLPEEQGCPF